MMYNIPNLKYLKTGNFFLLAGPCVIEDEDTPLRIAEHIVRLADKHSIPYVFKASYRKANRSKLDSFTGIGDENALQILEKVKKQFHIPVITDIHTPGEAAMVAEYAAIIQIPAFLCRQTELLIAAAETGCPVNIKKGQFLSPYAMKFAAQKVIDSGNSRVILTERGNSFGYSDLVVDMRGIPIMKKTNLPVVLDITHSLQQPNQASGVSGGQPEMIEILGRAGIAAGCDGIFIETHPEPEHAGSDGANMLPIDKLDDLLHKLLAIHRVVNDF